MGVLNDYRCAVHGYFENTEPACYEKDCDAEVLVVFLQAPAIGSQRTRGIDQTAKQLAIDFGMSNLKSTREGENQAGFFTRNNQVKEPVQSVEAPREPRPGDAAIWGGGRAFNMQGALMGSYARPVRDENVGASIPSLGKLTGPRIGSVIKDHENLSIPK